MTNTPIRRIPLEDHTEGQLINAEVKNGTIIADPAIALRELLMHTDEESHLSCTLDWAMQLRDRTGCDWGTAISAAMVLYFG